MSVALFIIMIVVSFIVVRIGAIAFQLTGLEWSLAKFQALSCFTGTGFTTKEAELITGNPQRRRIASILMVLGNAGLVILIATFASSLNPQVIIEDGITKWWLPIPLPSWLAPYIAWFNLLIMVLAIYVLFRIANNLNVTAKLTDFLRKKIIKTDMRRVSFEELATVTGGYGVTRVQVCKNSPVIDKNLIDAGFRKHDINLLAIARGSEVIPNPAANMVILENDELICFGKLGEIRQQIC